MNNLIRKKIFYAIPIIVLILFVFACVKANAEETEIQQEILNEKSNCSLQLNSQIKENGSIDKQRIKNIGSWFNININRNTYKFYYINPTQK